MSGKNGKLTPLKTEEIDHLNFRIQRFKFVVPNH